MLMVPDGPHSALAPHCQQRAAPRDTDGLVSFSQLPADLMGPHSTRQPPYGSHTSPWPLTAPQSLYSTPWGPHGLPQAPTPVHPPTCPAAQGQSTPYPASGIMQGATHPVPAMPVPTCCQRSTFFQEHRAGGGTTNACMEDILVGVHICMGCMPWHVPQPTCM